VRGLVKSAPAAANSFIASASALIGRITPKRISRGRTVMPNPLAGEVGASVTGKALWSPEIDVPTGRAPLFQSIKSHPSVKHSCGGAARRRPRDECFNETAYPRCRSPRRTGVLAGGLRLECVRPYSGPGNKTPWEFCAEHIAVAASGTKTQDFNPGARLSAHRVRPHPRELQLRPPARIACRPTIVAALT